MSMTYESMTYELCRDCDHFVEPNDVDGDDVVPYIHLSEGEGGEAGDPDSYHEAIPSGIRAPLATFRLLRPDLFDEDGAGHIGPNRPSHVMKPRGPVATR